MKTLTILLLAFALLCNVDRLHSQSTALPQSPAEIMAAMKATNEDTLKKQAATLDVLDQLSKTAAQIKIFAKRG